MRRELLRFLHISVRKNTSSVDKLVVCTGQITVQTIELATVLSVVNRVGTRRRRRPKLRILVDLHPRRSYLLRPRGTPQLETP